MENNNEVIDFIKTNFKAKGIEMQKEITVSLLTKIANIKTEIGLMVQDKKHHKGRYTSLSAIFHKVNELCAKNDLVVEVREFVARPRVFVPANEMKENVFRLVVAICDTMTGTERIFTCDILQDTTMPNPVQSFGATLTYAQRYAYGVIFSIAFDDEDPDSVSKPPARPMATAQTQNSIISKPQFDRVVGLVKQKGIANDKVSAIIQSAGYASLKEVEVKDLQAILDTLEGL